MELFTGTKRVTFVDIAKGIGIILVVAGHLFTYGSVIGKIIFSVHMPLFFILSGFFAKNRYVDSTSKYIKNAVNSCFVPWICFSVLGIAITYIVPTWRQDVSLTNLLDCLYTGQPEYFHIRPVWFLICLFWVKILFKVAYHIHEKIKDNKICVILFLMIMAAAAIYIKDVLNFLPYGRLPMKIDSALMGLFFYMIGYLIFPWLCNFEKTASVKNKKVVAVLSLGVWFYVGVRNGASNLCNLTYNDSGMFIVAAVAGCMFIITISMLIKESKILQYIGKNSMVIFAMHSFLIYLYDYILSAIKGKEIVHMMNIDWMEALVGTVLIVALMMIFTRGLLFVKAKVLKRKIYE